MVNSSVKKLHFDNHLKDNSGHADIVNNERRKRLFENMQNTGITRFENGTSVVIYSAAILTKSTILSLFMIEQSFFKLELCF